jgi:MarR family transcriptional regulator for hemolysin
MMVENFQADRNPEESILIEFRQVFLAVKSALGEYFGVTQARLLILQHLNSTEEVSQADLQKRLGVDGAVITRLVKQLEAEGMLTRRPDPSDNRFTLVSLTSQGQNQIKNLMVRLKALEPVLLDGVDAEEIDCIRRALRRVRQNAEAIRQSNRAEEANLKE